MKTIVLKTAFLGLALDVCNDPALRCGVSFFCVQRYVKSVHRFTTRKWLDLDTPQTGKGSSPFVSAYKINGSVFSDGEPSGSVR